MSKLDDLIAEVCPNGVVYKTLDEIATDMYRGSGIKRDQITETGTPCVRYGEIYTTYNIWFDSCVSHTDVKHIPNKKYFEHGDILFAITGESVEEIAKSCVYIGHEKCLAGGDIVVMKHNENPKYLAYALFTTEAQMQKSKGKVKSKVVHSSVPALKTLEIPIPPLPVQQEIVRILDKFTAQEAELEAELDAELEARRKQYEYYRNSLLNFSGQRDATVKWMTLGDVCENISSGKNKSRNDSGEFPVYGSTGIIANSDSYTYSEDLLLVARVGANAGFVHRATGRYDVSDNTLIVKPKKGYDISFAYYQLLNMKLNDLAVGGGQPLITAGKLKQTKIPVPSLKEQERIVVVLDRFEELARELTHGLPAEIIARRKQYEYYRDKLLTFKEKVL